ncbi:MAG TPA: glucoamylase family protein, partial [Pyrinomonadaceae bacterium]|nr:glucoamylase family protein [Pyrinomonadaceae bacterium]
MTTSFFTHPRGIPWSSHIRNALADMRANTAQVALLFVSLAHQAYLMVDAISRTLYRKLISRKRLLEWMTAAQAETGSRHNLAAFVRFMWPAELIAASIAALLLGLRPSALWMAAPILLVWAVSPLIAYLVSRRKATARPFLDEADKRAARLIARRTWRFFETFVGEEDNWLPPDNYQEDPQPVIAHRTSPTNTGLLLLSTVAAHDFGYISTLELMERLELTFATLQKLQKFRGHCFNWCDTRTLEPLSPHYISIVDSGNLAGHLLATKQAVIDLPDSPLVDSRIIDGLSDTISLMREEATRLAAIRQRTEVVTVRHLREEIEACAKLVAADPPQTLGAWNKLLDALSRRAEVITDILGALSQEHGDESYEELRFWVNALIHQSRACLRDLHTLAPWGNALAEHLGPIIIRCSTDAGAQWQGMKDSLANVPAPAQIPPACDAMLLQLSALRAQLEECLPEESRERLAALSGLDVVTSAIEKAAEAAKGLLARLAALATLSDRLFEETDFSFLIDEERKVFRIGYNVEAGRADNSYYDLLASEARLASFVAIAKNDAPQEHWFRMGRQLTPVNGDRALISWSATIFEYLMPLLVMRNYEGTLLDQTYTAIIRRQIEYGQEHNVPWGVSESAYNARDIHLNYQYGPFGVPGLGLKRGLSEDLVIAPYATLLAAPYAPRAALNNLRRLEREGALARYGFYESVDYTPERLPQNQTRVIIRAFMAHHQGMSLVALDNLLNDQLMQRRFHSEPLV